MFVGGIDIGIFQLFLIKFPFKFLISVKVPNSFDVVRNADIEEPVLLFFLDLKRKRALI
jgi:hypothetical protein